MKYLMRVQSVDELIVYNNAIDDIDFLENVASASEIASALSTVFNPNDIIDKPQNLNRTSFVIDISTAGYFEKMRMFEAIKTKFKTFIQRKGI